MVFGRGEKRLSKSWFAINWVAVGRTVLSQLPQMERYPFTQWLNENRDMLDIYAQSPGKALRLWKDSVSRYELYGEIEIDKAGEL